MDNIAASVADWPYLWAYFWTATLLFVSMGTFTPAVYSLCEQAGFPQPRNQPLNTYVHLFAGCQFMIGLASAILEGAGEWRAVSVIVACAFPMGIVGTTLSARDGGLGYGSPFWSHALLMTIGTSASWKLIQENW